MPLEIHTFSHEAMNTVFEAMICGQERHYAGQAAQAAFNEIDRMERMLSRFDPASEISQIAKLRAGESLPISHEVYECLSLARLASEMTGGLFDPTLGPLMRCWRGPGGVRLQPTPDQIEAARRRVGLERLVLSTREHLFVAGVAGEGSLEIDLGAIGKGYAIDRALEVVGDWEIDNLLLHAGTSTALAVGDGPGGEGWRLGIGGPWTERSITLRDMALSGSGTEVKGEHILDPRTGMPARHALGAWALCPSATMSDAFSTAFIIMAPEAMEKFCEENGEVAACAVYETESGPAARYFGSYFSSNASSA